MIIRKATQEDIPQIIELLKSSLGEGLIKKSEEAWRWKHEQNPFGPSPVLVAEESGEIIGVRAMMQWRFEKDGKIYKAVRAVDTATHPAHQGKGIFKKLTLKLIDELIDEGYDFIFNTPNDQSRPGYLKMGWEELYRIPIRLKVLLMFKSKEVTPNEYTIESGKWPILDDSQRAYFKWRYQDNPLAHYYQFSYGKSGIVFFRIKENKYFNEFRICDTLIDEAEFKQFKIQLKLAMSTFKSRVASVGSPSIGSATAFYSKCGFLPKMDKGLLLTSRKLNTDFQEYFSPSESTSFDLGTYELF